MKNKAKKILATLLVTFCLFFCLYKPITPVPPSIQIDTCCCENIKDCNDISCSVKNENTVQSYTTNTESIDASNCFCHNEHTTITFLKNTLFFEKPNHKKIHRKNTKKYISSNQKSKSNIIKIPKKPPKHPSFLTT